MIASLLFFLAAAAWADYRNSFETAEVSWQLADADSPVRLVVHQRDYRVAHSGHASEQIGITAGRGTYIYLVHPIDRARVIAEWGPSLWVQADRPGMQLMARVVLPRSRDPRTDSPVTTLLRGDIYERVGSWQQLWIHRPDQLLQRQVRVLRSQFGPDIDAREAYVDLIVLNGYGGVGNTNIWLDDLEITGQVPAAQLADYSRPEDAGAAPDTTDRDGGYLPASGQGAPEVRLQGSVLVAGGVPLLPRAIQGNGESLEFLQSLGFNAVWLSTAPTAVQLREADRLGIWLIAPPPNDRFITPAHDRVLAWDLGGGLADAQLEITRQRVTELRKADIRTERPLIAEAGERLWSYSRLVSFLVMRASPIGTSLSLPHMARVFRERPTLARPGTPVWTTVPTEPASALIDQWSALGVGPPLSLVAEPEQIRLMAYEAIASGSRGLLFLSRSPLDRSDADARSRAGILRQINLELQAIEPWPAAGTRLADVPCGREDVKISVLQTERAQLLVILSQDPSQQYTRGPAARGPLTFVVPSAVNSPQVYRLTPGGLQTMTHRRVAGGIRLTLEDLDLVNLVAIAQDPLVLNHLARSLAGSKAELAGCLRDTAAGQLELVETLHQQLIGPSQPSTAESWLQQARANLRHCELLLGASDHATACQFAEKTLEGLSYVRRTDWETASGSFPSPSSSPYCATLAALTLHWEMARRLQASPAWSANLLPAGDFESLDHLRHVGWQNYAAETRNILSRVELAGDTPHGGNSALRLMVSADTSAEPPVAFEVAPLKIVSAPVPVRRGQLIRLHGWVRIPYPIQSSSDGLKIYDSMGGEPLALRIYETDDWKEFASYRAATRDGEVVVTFELTGIGDVSLDDIEVTLHDPIADQYPDTNVDQARRLPPVMSTRR